MTDTDYIDLKTSLATANANIINFMDSFKEHGDNDNERFRRTEIVLKEGFKNCDDKFEKQQEILNDLLDMKNKLTGAYILGSMVTGVMIPIITGLLYLVKFINISYRL